VLPGMPGSAALLNGCDAASIASVSSTDAAVQSLSRTFGEWCNAVLDGCDPATAASTSCRYRFEAVVAQRLQPTLVKGVFAAPGSTTFTLMPSGAQASAKLLASGSSAPLLAQYAACVG
jgi:hypothetical protein